MPGKPVTIVDLQAIVDRWTPRLGLAHWTITVRNGNMDHDDAILEIHRHEDAHRAVITPAAWLLAGQPEPDGLETIDSGYIERSVVHELCHCLFRDLRYLVRDVTADELAGSTKATLGIALDRHEEATVDLLARSLVTAWETRDG